MRELVEIDASKNRLALEVDALFRRSRRLGIRLALSDHRRATKTQIDRLGIMITMIAPRDQPAAAPMPEGNFDLTGVGELPDAAVFGPLLRASLAAVAQYETAVATATAEHLPFAVNLLAVSLAEERQAVDRLVSTMGSINEE
jgi:hypothetical protein